MWTAAWQRQTSESWTLKLSSFVGGCCGVRCRKWLGALAGLGITAPAATKRRRNNEDCGRVAGVGVRGPLTNPCPNGAAHTSPGQRPGNQTTHISAFQRNAADGRITHPRRNPRPNDAALLQSASIPTICVPHAYPPSNPQGCTLGWYALTLWVKWNAADRASPTCPPRPSRSSACSETRSLRSPALPGYAPHRSALHGARASLGLSVGAALPKAR